MIKQHLGSIIIAGGIVVAAIILACAFRFSAVTEQNGWSPIVRSPGSSSARTFDHWTGEKK
ncbi:MAG: hypothetical protein WCS31_13355 [Verrucomicrobiae bacterium]